jgi:phospholipase C
MPRNQPELRNRWAFKTALGTTFGVALAALASTALADNDQSNREHAKTATPIKHVIVLIGENRTFDNVFATYEPKKGQKVWNLLSRGIVHANGQPGPNWDAARQFQVGTINPPAFFISTNKLISPNKTAYGLLPSPEVGGVPPQAITLNQFQNDPVDSLPPFDSRTFSNAQLGKITQGLLQDDLRLLTTGATGQRNCNTDSTTAPLACPEPDLRIANSGGLPNTAFELSGLHLPYDSYTGDMVHRFFHMWQQSDCDVANATKTNPAGCKNDLYPYVGIARADDSGGNAMGFYNMQKGHAPLFKFLADNFTMNDNYHQPVMGGTAVQHTMLMTGDALPWDRVAGFPAVPPANRVADPTPKSSTDAGFVRDQRWTKCGDQTQPGIKPIMDYLKSLPWRPDLSKTNCEPERFYMINNLRPAYLSNGAINTAAINDGTAAPPSSLRTIGDALNEKHISWAYYGGGYNAAARFDNGSKDPVDVLIGTGGDWYCDICNSFQYSKSIMGDAAQRQQHIKDLTDFFDGLDRGQLPSVAYVKPDSFLDGHPETSKLNLLEGLTEKILVKLFAHPELFAETAFIVTFDEGGGYWDSGFFQPVDFFGDGPRIPFIVVSPFSRGGEVVHSYTDHASVLKFIERNWGLGPLTHRSRDNLPNPKMNADNPYVPANMPAVGDLFDMFHFDQGRNDHDRDDRG